MGSVNLYLREFYHVLRGIGIMAGTWIICFVPVWLAGTELNLPWYLEIIPALIATALVVCEEIAWYPRRKYGVKWVWEIPESARYLWYYWSKAGNRLLKTVEMRVKGWFDLVTNLCGIWVLFGALRVWL